MNYERVRTRGPCVSCSRHQGRVVPPKGARLFVIDAALRVQRQKRDEFLNMLHGEWDVRMAEGRVHDVESALELWRRDRPDRHGVVFPQRVHEEGVVRPNRRACFLDENAWDRRERARQRRAAVGGACAAATKLSKCLASIFRASLAQPIPQSNFKPFALRFVKKNY